jgi:hypothetical protein
MGCYGDCLWAQVPLVEEKEAGVFHMVTEGMHGSLPGLQLVCTANWKILSLEVAVQDKVFGFLSAIFQGHHVVAASAKVPAWLDIYHAYYSVPLLWLARVLKAIGFGVALRNWVEHCTAVLSFTSPPCPTTMPFTCLETAGIITIPPAPLVAAFIEA